MNECGDPHHRHRTEAAARACEKRKLAYRQANPADPLYVPLEQRTVTVVRQLPPAKRRR